MGGDSDSKKKSKDKKDDALPAYMASGETAQPFMPGFDNMIAQQLAAGGYGAAPDLLTYMQQFYSPMQVPGPPAPVTPAPSGGGGGGGDSEHRGRWRDLGTEFYNDRERQRRLMRQAR